LIDVELFALDIQLKYAGKNQTINGILDIALMRPGEFGSEISQDVVYKNGLMYAGKRFIVDDIYTMQKLGLRDDKGNKDRKRIYTIVKSHKNNIKNNLKLNNLYNTFKNVSKKRINVPARPKMNISALKKKAITINPLADENRITPPAIQQAIRMAMWVRGFKGIRINGMKRTSGTSRFNVNSEQWVPNESTKYIKNEATHRMERQDIPKNSYTLLKHTLYGFNPVRNKKMNNKTITKAAMLQFAGLKNKSFIKHT
jgi:hypothetical protein